MSSIRESITSVMEQLKVIPASPFVSDGSFPDQYSGEMFKTVAILNNQIELMKNGENYSFLSPAAFVEVNTSNHEVLGMGYTAYDVEYTIHILNEMLDSGIGTLDQDLYVFDLRNGVKEYLTMFRPTQTGNLMYFNEEQDFKHDNCYHYKIMFKGRIVDPVGNTMPVEVDGPWNLDLQVKYCIGITYSGGL